MKKITSALAIFAIVLPLALAAQEKSNKKDSALYSEKLEAQEKELDAQIKTINNKIADVVKRYDLLNTKNIRVLPYQTAYELGPDFIEIEKHQFMREDIYRDRITGLRTKKIKLYISGQTISKIESIITERNYDNGQVEVATIVDPSPFSAGTENITFSHTYRGKVIVENRKFGDMKNSTAFPTRNEIKRDFVIPHLTLFYNSLLFISESYYKSLRDVDETMTEYLKKSTGY